MVPSIGFTTKEESLVRNLWLKPSMEPHRRIVDGADISGSLALGGETIPSTISAMVGT